MDIDLGDAYDFVDEDGKPYKLRFRRNWAPRNDPRIFDGTGQLIAVVADVTRADNHTEIAISRPHVAQATSNEPCRAGNSGPPSSTPSPTA